jgi:hypothetical protein
VAPARTVHRRVVEERKVSKSISTTIRLLATACVLVGCQHAGRVGGPPPAADSADGAPGAAGKAAAAQPMAQPVTLWDKGKPARDIDAAKPAPGIVLINLGEEWTPYILTERSNPDEQLVPHTYRATYLDLAKGKLPTDQKGARVRRDKYLELYGIMPTFNLLRERFRKAKERGCDGKFDIEALRKYEGIIAAGNIERLKKQAAHESFLSQKVDEMLEKQGVTDVEELDTSRLSRTEQTQLRDLQKMSPPVRALRAAQARLKCEGFFEGKGKWTPGVLDWTTNEALAEFERRHRVFGWGFIAKESLKALRIPSLELERRAVVRVLVERAMHAAAFIEDGSASTLPDGKPRTFKGSDGKDHPIPNLEGDLAGAIEEAFGLKTPESALGWLEQLGDLPASKLVAVQGPARPEYHGADMDLSVTIDRGDVWYEFPYDERGVERGQPVSHRPKLTLLVTYLGQKIPIAEMGTTIGGWRSEIVDGANMWKYKGSPTGMRIWKQIAAAPVWMPPNTTPPKTLLQRVGSEQQINYHEIGPSYASAYGMVAAYHQTYKELEDGSVEPQGDEAIRTHGSVDYMSIMERHSHGCHRLYNHLAVRLFSFVLAHRPHRRLGAQSLGFRLPFEHEGNKYTVEIDKGGYMFDLDKPIFVDVQRGRVLGSRWTPIAGGLPKYDDQAGAYVMPDGTRVRVDRQGTITPIQSAGADAGASPDGGAAP